MIKVSIPLSTKVRFLSTIILILFASDCFTQPEGSKFGRVSDDELDMVIYAADSSASALILFDIGQSEFQYNQNSGSFEIRFSRHVRIKILTTDGFEWADFSIPLYSASGQSERLSRIRAYTFNKTNGNVEKMPLNNSDLIDEKSSDRVTIRKFTMPQVRVGSVIDLNYEITSDFFFSLQTWNFQYTIPVLASSYTTIIPEYYTYRQHISGYVQVDTKSASKTQIIQFRDHKTHNYRTDLVTYYAVNVEALPFESYVDNRNNYRSNIEFELKSIFFPGSTFREFTSTWESIVKELDNHPGFGAQLSGTRYMHDDLQNFEFKDLSPEEQITKVFNFVRNKISWNQQYSLTTNVGVRQAYRNGSGNSAEVNFSLINALREIGFNVFPVALSTRSNGRIFPHQVTITRLNHVIALVKTPEKEYLVDATSSFPNPFILPSECLNEKGRIIDETNNNWINLDQAGTSRSITIKETTLQEDGTEKGSVILSCNNYLADIMYRNTNTESKLNDYIKILGRQYQNAIIEICEATLDKENPEQFKLSFTYETGETMIAAGNMIYLNPFVGFGFDLNPFKKPERKLPVNFTFPQEIRYINKITVPHGYQIEEYPENLNIMLKQGNCQFLLSTTFINNEVVVTARLTINRIIFPAEEYSDMKSFFDAIIKKQEEKIIFKKI